MSVRPDYQAVITRQVQSALISLPLFAIVLCPLSATMIQISYIVVVLVVVGFETTSALECVSCENSTCVPPPPTCELGQRPCSCCMECRIKLGGQCGPFSPECESKLVCLTNGGAFNGRPPYWMTFVGKCVRPESLAKTSIKPSQLVPTPPKAIGRRQDED